MRRLPIVIGVIVVLLFIAMSAVFIVDERKQALVLQFGQVKQVKTEPGIGFKLPLIQDVLYYEGRILPLDTQPLEVTPLDERRLVVDAFARWRIVDPVEFRQAVQTEAAAEQRLGSILNASLREVLGSVPSEDVLSPERTVLMTRIRDSARSEAQGLGIEIIDVRIRRADLPEQNLNATFERMNAEREREAADERARGKERAQEIRATADRQAVELVSDAERQAAIILGEADAERNRIYADAYGRDEEFFAFYRSLEAYERALQGDNSTLVITPNSEFFEYLKSVSPNGSRQPQTISRSAAPAGAAPVGEAPTGQQPERQGLPAPASQGEPAAAEIVAPAEVVVEPAEVVVEPAPARDTGAGTGGAGTGGAGTGGAGTGGAGTGVGTGAGPAASAGTSVAPAQ
jgi:modulator of FtsH protease HflC